MYVIRKAQVKSRLSQDWLLDSVIFPCYYFPGSPISQMGNGEMSGRHFRWEGSM